MLSPAWALLHVCGRTGLLDTTEFAGLDYHLVLTGPPAPAASSRGLARPWCIQAAFVFDARELRAAQFARGVRRGIASSVRRENWDAAEIYPRDNCALMTPTEEQIAMLQLFSPPTSPNSRPSEQLGI